MDSGGKEEKICPWKDRNCLYQESNSLLFAKINLRRDKERAFWGQKLERAYKGLSEEKNDVILYLGVNRGIIISGTIVIKEES